MWIPTPIYERIPQFWLLLGLLFMSSGTYLGFEYTLSFVYFIVGFVCAMWSIRLFVMRMRHRKLPESALEQVSPAEQQPAEAQQPELHQADDLQADDLSEGAGTPA